MSNAEQATALAYEKVRTLTIVTLEGQQPKKEIDFILIKPRFFLKRSFDIVFSLLVIVFVLSWLLPILAIFIKIDSKGPVFFIQKRVGAFGKIFRCIKLRTMVVNSEANILQAQANDPRITLFGKFLRLSCMDELPQFF